MTKNELYALAFERGWVYKVGDKAVSVHMSIGRAEYWISEDASELMLHTKEEALKLMGGKFAEVLWTLIEFATGEKSDGV